MARKLYRVVLPGRRGRVLAERVSRRAAEQVCDRHNRGVGRTPIHERYERPATICRANASR